MEKLLAANNRSDQNRIIRVSSLLLFLGLATTCCARTLHCGIICYAFTTTTTPVKQQKLSSRIYLPKDQIYQRFHRRRDRQHSYYNARQFHHRHSFLQSQSSAEDPSSLPPTTAATATTVTSDTTTTKTESSINLLKNDLFTTLDNIPANVPTPPDTTQKILSIVRQLEQEGQELLESQDRSRQTRREKEEDDQDDDDPGFLNKLVGNWELVWTTQDRESKIYNDQKFWKTFINPLENQSYSNNPSGRLNPVLPREIQDRLEKMGIISTDDNGDIANVFRSTQSIDIQKRRVRNVVTFAVPSFPTITRSKATSTSTRRASLTVDIDFIRTVPSIPTRVEVKFQACCIVIPGTPIDLTFPLGLIGPTGWLQTDYIDDEMRITRGHKGSVFILRRPLK